MTIVGTTKSGYRSAQRVIAHDDLKRAVWPVMGMRLWYGVLRDRSGVAELTMVGSGFVGAEARARPVRRPVHRHVHA